MKNQRRFAVFLFLVVGLVASVPRPPLVNPNLQSLFRYEALATSPLFATTPLNEAVQARILQIRALMAEIQRELRLPGSSSMKTMVYISDQHGDILKFDYLILDVFRQFFPGRIPENFVMRLDSPLAKQFEALGISWQEVQEKIYFHNLGDFMDRGPYGLKVLRRSEQLIEAGISDFVIGNHCLWTAMNLWGFHLPFYDHYQFYGTRDAWGDLSAFHQKILASHPETREAQWWVERLAAFTVFHRNKQTYIWFPLDIEVNGSLNLNGKRVKGQGLYAQVSSSLITETQKKLWDRFRGNMFKSEIFTGVRAVGEMSLGWWQELRSDFAVEYEALKHEADFDSESPATLAWLQAMRMMDETILPEVKRDLEQQVSEGKWEWRIFEALNSQNYRSPEWWAKDWIFHEGWGTAVLKELNEEILDPAQRVTASNYFTHPRLRHAAEFYRRHFNLVIHDGYLNTAAHAFIPVNKEGQFHFVYQPVGKSQPVEYVGERVWEGLARISEDVRNPSYSFHDIYPALSLVNSWYADETTQAKVPNVADILNSHRTEILAHLNGFKRFFSGHLPFFEFHTKLSEDKRGRLSGFQVDGRIIFTDHGMAEKFGSRGGMVLVGPQGIRLRGWPTKDTPLHEIQDDPPTAEWHEDELDVFFTNTPVLAQAFLTQLVDELEALVQGLITESGNPSERSPALLEAA